MIDLEYYIKQNYGAKGEMVVEKKPKSASTSSASSVRINDYRHSSRYFPREEDEDFVSDYALGFNHVRIVHKVEQHLYWDYTDLKPDTFYKTELHGYIKVIKAGESKSKFVLNANPYPATLEDIAKNNDNVKEASTNALLWYLHDYTEEQINDYLIND